MKTKPEFVEAFVYELSGMILASFTQAERPDMAEKGRFITVRLAQIRPMLERMHDYIAEAKPDPIKNSAESLTEELLKAHAELNDEGKKKMVERLRGAFAAQNGRK